MSMRHEVFFSRLLGIEVGYNIFLPEGYDDGVERYPVHYHIHGWQCDEFTDIETLKETYCGRRAITVFPNVTPVSDMPGSMSEELFIKEIIPHIDGAYRTIPDRNSRSISGFSMGGGMAFAFAVKYHEMFSAVTAYAGTYHHFYHPDYSTVGEPAEKAADIYRAMISEEKFDRGLHADYNIVALVMRNADAIRRDLDIALHVGTADILYCDNEIMRLHLENLGIPHIYRRFAGAAHCLKDIL